MYLPHAASLHESHPSALAGNTLFEGSAKGPGNGWSSLIGIITAICGNILISFALNTQRYAHMRLSRDRDELEEKQKADRRRSSRGKSGSYGTQQEDIAEQRAAANTRSESAQRREEHYLPKDVAESDETQPLIPRVDGREAAESVSSDATARPNEKEDEEPEEKSYLKSPIWWLGIGLMVLGEAGNFLAYGFAPASIVSPLGVVALVSNCLIAPLLLGEQFRWRDGLGVVIAIAGAVTVVLSASDSNPRLTPDKILHLITRWEFETYFGITVFLIVALSVASNKYGDRTVLIDLGLVGLYGGYTALSTKGIASLLSNTIWHVVTFPITYLLVAVLVLTAVMQIKYVNRALQRFNATQVIPIQFVMFTISVILGSAILYRDFEREAAGDAAKFVGGCALTFLGVWCITSGRGGESEGDEESDEEADAVDLLDEEHVQSEIREREDSGGRRPSVALGSSGQTPQLNRHRTTSIAPSVVVTPAMRPASSDQASDFDLEPIPSQESLHDMPPATAAAIHSKSLTQLGQPQQPNEADSDNTRKPQLHATTSTPIIPSSTLTSPSRPRTPLNRNQTERPFANSPSRRSPNTQTATASTAPRRPSLDPNTSNRLVGLLPGPLTSPLSSSLSAIVADSLRRGVDSSTAGPLNRRRSSRVQQRRPGMEGYRAASQRGPDAAAAAQAGRPSFASAETGGQEGQGSPKGRVRSVSATVGDSLGMGRQRSERRISESGDER
ncbi:hypothetical protein B0A50_02067 [Salinomyces thailandicus]|uniref:DUF803-domain-containing protein n=1 Tax=Salinomyces thailandicus TaxID=706561 RepID=A0A4U0U7K7_9PEZI|nr:hypothetical protein B0A50_02067 [Salinomyces thailandica]